MPGVRVRHPTERNVLLSVEHPGRPFQNPYPCPICRVVHLKKTYHFRLDDVGAAIVSPQISDRLKQIGGLGITVVDTVNRPPAQGVGLETEGYRVQHESARSCLFVVEDPYRPYPHPAVCSTCKKVHLFKAYHFQLDGEGRTYISQEIFDKWAGRTVPGLRFEMNNALDIGKAPDQDVNVVIQAPGRDPQIVEPKIRKPKPNVVRVPRRRGQEKRNG